VAITKGNKGRILAVCTSSEKHVKKEPHQSCLLLKEHGLDGDSHAGPGHKQVSLLARESVVKMERDGLKLPAGVFGENILTEGIELLSLEVGQRVKAGGSAVLEITEKGKTCVTPCSIFQHVGFCVMPTEGIFARVVEPGELFPGDTLEVME